MLNTNVIQMLLSRDRPLTRLDLSVAFGRSADTNILHRARRIRFVILVKNRARLSHQPGSPCINFRRLNHHHHRHHHRKRYKFTACEARELI